MAASSLLYYITDRAAFPGDERNRRLRLLDKIAEAASAGVDLIQIREKDLTSRELESLAYEAVRTIGDSAKLRTALLINSRTDVALATAAAGVHLRASDASPSEVRTAWMSARTKCIASAPSINSGQALACENSPQNPIISTSCHSPEEVDHAASNGATFAVFAPIFEKNDAPGTRPTGLDTLRKACSFKIPVFALGGVSLQNAQSCLHAGAAGIAAIRLFQENDAAAVVHVLRGY